MAEAPLAAPGQKLVLMVDDDESLLDLMEHVVKKEGFRTDRAEDGMEALRKAQALKPDAMVLDMMLPGLGGFEVMRQLQAVGCGGIPIIVVTGRQMDPNAVELIRQEPNVKDFMEKPVRPAVLIAALHRLLKTQPVVRAPQPGS
jgi:CheY-like chemotaxis protein